MSIILIKIVIIVLFLSWYKAKENFIRKHENKLQSVYNLLYNFD